MPLKRGYSPKSIAKNIATEMKKHPRMSNQQAVAIALSTARAAATRAGKTAIARRLTPPKKK